MDGSQTRLELKISNGVFTSQMLVLQQERTKYPQTATGTSVERNLAINVLTT